MGACSTRLRSPGFADLGQELVRCNQLVSLEYHCCALQCLVLIEIKCTRYTTPARRCQPRRSVGTTKRTTPTSEKGLQGINQSTIYRQGETSGRNFQTAADLKCRGDNDHQVNHKGRTWHNVVIAD